MCESEWKVPVKMTSVIDLTESRETLCTKDFGSVKNVWGIIRTEEELVSLCPDED